MKHFLSAIICFASYFIALGAGSGEVPPWVKGNLPPKSNDSYTFMISDGSGASVSEAQKDADLMLVSNLMRSAGVTITGNQIEKMFVTSHNDQVDEKQESAYQYELTYGDVTVSFRAVDRYYTQKGNNIEVKTLYEVAKNPLKVRYDAVEYTTSYGARGLWRSAIIPGWGQMYKKQYVKGSLIFVAEAALVTSALIYENQRTSYRNKAAATSDTNAIKFYQNHANTSKNIRNGLIAGAAAVYVYNIVDAIVSKGKIRYVKPSSHNFSMMPYHSSDTYAGVYLSYSF